MKMLFDRTWRITRKILWKYRFFVPAIKLNFDLV